MIQRLKQLGLSGALVGAGILLGGVAHAGDETIVAQSQDVVTASDTSTQNVSESVSIVQSSTSIAGATGSDSDSTSVPTPSEPVVSEPTVTNEPSAATVIASDAASVPVAQVTPISLLPESVVPTRNAPIMTMSDTYKQAAVWYDLVQADSSSEPAVIATPIHPTPVLPPAGSLQLAGVWSAITLPLTTLLGQQLLSSRADSWPLALQMGILLLLSMTVGFVAYLRRSGYAHAARSDAAANYFATPSLNVSLMGTFRPI